MNLICLISNKPACQILQLDHYCWILCQHCAVLGPCGLEDQSPWASVGTSLVLGPLVVRSDRLELLFGRWSRIGRVQKRRPGAGRRLWTRYARQRIINLGDSGEIHGNSGKFCGNQMKKPLIFFHSFSQVRNTFTSSVLGKSNSLISPVATVQSGEKMWKGIHRETWIPFHFISPSLRQVSIAQYCQWSYRERNFDFFCIYKNSAIVMSWLLCYKDGVYLYASSIKLHWLQTGYVG